MRRAGRIRLTNSLIQKAEPRFSRYSLYDDEVPGLILRVEPSGNKLFYVDYSTREGKRSSYKLASASVMTVAQARDAARGFLALVACGEEIPGKRSDFSNVTVGEYFEESYFPWVRANRKTGDGTVQILETQFAFLWDVKLNDVSLAKLEAWRVRRIREVKAASLNRMVGALKAAFNWGVKRGMFEANPLARFDRLQERDSQAKVRYLSDEERGNLLAALDAREEKLRKDRDAYNKWRLQRHKEPIADLREAAFADHLKPMVLISLNTGIRRGALFALRWGDVDLGRRMLTLRGEEAKSGKENHVPLNDVAHVTFAKWRDQSADKRDGALVFPSPKNGQRLTNCDSAWETLLKMAKIENFRWHDMRHDFASQLVMRGADLNTVRELLGHADMKMTLRYAHLAPQVKMQAVSLLNE